MNLPYSPVEFQKNLFSFVSGVIPVDAMSFNIFLPKLRQGVASNEEVNNMANEYHKKYWKNDPLNPSNFKGTDVKAISNTVIMPDSSWKATKLFKELLKPYGFSHKSYVFFRKEGEIIAFLTLLRKNMNAGFIDKEVEILEKIQPFVEYSLNKVFLRKRLFDRSYLSKKYRLTYREIDVIEYVITGYSHKVVASYLNIRLTTLRTHLQNIYNKVDVHSSGELMSKLFIKPT